jgi:hypothetical protein
MFVNPVALLLLSALLTSTGLPASSSEAFSRTPREVLAWARVRAKSPTQPSPRK